VDEIYPNGFEQPEHYELGVLDEILEGAFRPGHFQGVCRVVNRLLKITQPDNLYLGQKDYQQCMVIRRLVELTGQQTSVRICPTLREKDGLAMSSRNMRLRPAEREKAVLIYQMLMMAKTEIRPGSVLSLKHNILDTLRHGGFRPDYFEFAAAEDLSPIDTWNGTDKIVAVTAAFLNEVRLIDNMIIT
jgi:pantoate--beta-alanine ligase